ncbi:hypothetical protein [Actinomadura flavalba]|uniref:hypothetical protein n=1 Tax=Actinomadura flavalba TaxID=1120938 RepID=UPI000366B321|nr:hypothetical protein [Actinomadura flavalba]
MTDDADAPLDGDIGPRATRPEPAARPDPTPEPERQAEAEEAEAAEARRARVNAVAGTIARVLAALLLVFLLVDSARTALEARDRGDGWLHPPGTVMAICAAGLAWLVFDVVRRRRR